MPTANPRPNQHREKCLNLYIFATCNKWNEGSGSRQIVSQRTNWVSLKCNVLPSLNRIKKHFIRALTEKQEAEGEKENIRRKSNPVWSKTERKNWSWKRKEEIGNRKENSSFKFSSFVFEKQIYLLAASDILAYNVSIAYKP